jgi:hypothetical protein
MGNGRMNHDAARGTTSEAQVPTVQGKVMPGSRPYLRLAEVGYLAQFALSSFLVILLAAGFAGFDSAYAKLLSSTLVAAVIGLVLAVAWAQLGRKQGVSWFVAAGVLGGVSAVLNLVALSGPSPSLLGLWFALDQAVSIVSVAYFATQLLAFYTASKTFHVGLFKYAAYLLAIGFVASPFLGVVMVESAAMQPAGEFISNLVYGVALLFSAATSLAVGLGFHRLGRALP